MKNIGIINDQHLYSGTYTYAINIHKNLLNHNLDSEFYQLLLSDTNLKLPQNVTLLKGFGYNINASSKAIYNLKLAVNYLSGHNWKIFKNIEANTIILSGPSLLLLSKFFPKTIATVHDLYFLENKNLILRAYMKRLFKLYNQQKTIIANSNFTRNEFIKKLQINADNIITVYPSFDSKFFSPGKSIIRSQFKFDNNDRILLSIGGDNPNKNIETILRVIKGLPDKYKLIRVGRNLNIQKIIDNLGLRQRIIFLNNVDQETLRELYRGSDYLIFPSLFEGFGSPIVEAMASGLPVITSNGGSIPEVVAGAGLTFDPLDTTGMQKAIIELDRDENIRRELIIKGLKRSADFSPENQFISLSCALKMSLE